ncbi:MAG: hypothetical protein WEA99_09910 [Brumimicrobium sp.]
MIINENNIGQTDPDTDKTVGIVAYITLIGFIISIILNADKKGEEKKFGAFHLRQSLGVLIVAVSFFIIISIVTVVLTLILPFLGVLFALVANIAAIGFLVLMILGIINAANGDYKEIPIIGKYASKFLGNTFE